MNFDTHNVDWHNVSYAAKSLSVADVVVAAEDAARRSVLLDKNYIETSQLLNSMERRKKLHSLGTHIHEPQASAPNNSSTGRKKAL